MTLAGRKVLLLAASDFEDMELLYPLYRLREEDAGVTVAELDDQPVTGKKGHGPVAVDTTVDGLSATDFDALVIPGGYAPDKLRRSETVLDLVPGVRRRGEADRLYLPRRLGADLREDRQGPPGDQRGRDPRRHGQRRSRLGGPGHGRGRQPHLRPDPRRPGPLDEGTAARAGRLRRLAHRHGIIARHPIQAEQPHRVVVADRAQP